MEFVGEYLKKTRIKKKITIQNIAKNLNISMYVITKIENDDFSDDLNIVYITGHIRAYAKFLNLDQNEIVKKFKSQIFFENKINQVDLPKPIEINNFFNLSHTISFFSFLLISISFYFFFIKSNDFNPDYAITPKISLDLEAEVEKVQLTTDLNYIKNDEQKNINSLDNLFVFEQQKELALSQIQVNASIPALNQLSSNSNKITLKFLDSTWIQIRDNTNRVILSKLMNINEDYSYFANDNYYLTTGNAGNIVILIDGTTKGKLGKKGEVIETLIINSDFTN